MKPKKQKNQKSLKKRLTDFVHSAKALRLLICADKLSFSGVS